MTDIDKLIERLLRHHMAAHAHPTGSNLFQEAADAVEQQRAEIDALKHDIEHVMTLNTELLNGETMQQVLHDNAELEAALTWAVSIMDQLEESGAVLFDPNMPDHVRQITIARKLLSTDQENV